MGSTVSLTSFDRQIIQKIEKRLHLSNKAWNEHDFWPVGKLTASQLFGYVVGWLVGWMVGLWVEMSTLYEACRHR